MTKIIYDLIPSPVGPLLGAWHDAALCALLFHDDEERTFGVLRARFGDVEFEPADDPYGFRARVEAYFAGDFTAFDSVALDAGGTAFQRKVWSELRRIPPGRTVSYGEIAARIKSPAACRAVGLANGQNPIAIVVPCHRVIGANGRLTGYGGGLDRKRWLLQHESAGAALLR